LKGTVLFRRADDVDLDPVGSLVDRGDEGELTFVRGPLCTFALLELGTGWFRLRG
jgi:hypothetical protein